MKLKIALSGYAGGESNLISLKNPVPNGDYHYFGMNPISHNPNNRRLNPQLDNSPSGIVRRKKKTVEAEEELSVTDGEGLGDEAPEKGKNILPPGEDMYYGLKPLEHNPISQMVLSQDFSSRIGLNEPVWFTTNYGRSPATVIAITFLPGKVLYTLSVETGYKPTSDYANSYGLVNAIYWDEKGNECIRISNVDSIYVEPREVKF